MFKRGNLKINILSSPLFVFIKNKRKLCFTISVFVIVILVSFFYFKIDDLSGDKSAILRLEEEYIKKESTLFKDSGAWGLLLAKRGGEEASRQIIARYADQPYTVNHDIGHLAGDLFYRNFETGALSFCGESLGVGLGCHHQVVITAIAHYGIGVISRLAKTCVETYGRLIDFCAHGIGHGVMEFYGDDEPALVKALDSCEKLEVTTGGVADKKRDNASGYCFSGVMMQYQRTLLAHRILQEGIPVRPVDENNPTAPCSTSVPERFRRDCYLSLGQWWSAYYGQKYLQMSGFCTSVPADYQSYCYRGIGVDIRLSNNLDARAVLKVCRSFPSVFAQNYCRIGAAQTIQLEKKDSPNIVEICRGLIGEYYTECIK